MNIRDRLMSRASVAVMAAFAPKKEGDGGADTSKVGQAENVDDGAPSGGGSDAGELGGLSAEEQAQFDAMQSGAAADDTGNVDNEPDKGGDGDGEEGEEAAEGDDDGAGGADGADGAAADGAAEGADEGNKNKRISLGKHKREVEKLRKQIADREAEIEKGRTERVRLDERTRMLLEAISAKPKAADPAAPADKAAPVDDDPEPDKEQDPIGHLQWKVRKQDKELEALRTGVTTDRQQTQAERAAETLYNTYEQDLTEANSSDPNVGDAFVHYRESRYKELGWHFANLDITDEAQTSQLTDEQQSALSQAIKTTFHKEQMQMAANELQAGRRPSAKLVQLARARGFAPKTAEQRAAEAAAAGGGTGGGNGSGNGAGGKVPAKAAPQGSVKDQLDSIRAGQQTAKSLSDGGGAQGGEMTPERLAKMTDDEFEAFYSQTSKNKFDRIMGKPAVQ